MVSREDDPFTKVALVEAKFQARELEPKLSSGAKVLLDPQDEAFKESCIRFSDIDRQTPGAIFQPATETDIVTIVQRALERNIPFVGKSGGHSIWSNIGEDGWIVDFALMQDVVVDAETKRVTLAPGVNAKTLNLVLAEHGLCTASTAAATVGTIPATLGGGRSWLTPLHGLACDAMVSARIMTSSQGLVTASATSNPELFWALKGAGQFFGLVTSMTLLARPFDIPILEKTFIFPATRISDVATALQELATDANRASPWLAVITQPPGAPKPMLAISLKQFVSEEDGEKIVAPLVALGPLNVIRKTISFAQITDGVDAMFKPGGFRTMFSCGMQKYEPEKLVSGLKVWEDMVAELPSANTTFFTFDWMASAGLKENEGEGSAWSHRDTECWVMAYISAPEEEAAQKASKWGEVYVHKCQEGQEEAEKSLFPNHTRVHSIEQRYRGAERLAKLKELKKFWDPKGVFTTQLLD